jgi:hypothetical protein
MAFEKLTEKTPKNYNETQKSRRMHSKCILNAFASSIKEKTENNEKFWLNFGVGTSLMTGLPTANAFRRHSVRH